MSRHRCPARFSWLPRRYRCVALALLCVLCAAARASYYAEAERYDAGSPFSPLTVGSDALASAGQYITGTGSTTAPSGQARYTFTAPTNGHLSLYVRRFFADNGKNSFYWKLEGVSNWRTFSPPENSRYAWGRMAVISNVAAGVYTLVIAGRENGSRIDAFYMSMHPARPVECKGLTRSSYIEAEDHLTSTAVPPLTVAYDTTARGGRCIAYPAGEINTNTSDSVAGRVRYGFTVQYRCTATVWARVLFSNTSSDSLFYRLDTSAWSVIEGPVCSSWSWIQLATHTGIAPGLHYLELLRREPGVKIDALFVSIDGSIPYAATTIIEAEAYTNTTGFAPLAVRGEVAAQCGGYIVWPTSGQADTTPSDSDTGQACYSVMIGPKSTLDIWARVLCPSLDDDLLYHKLEGVTDWLSNEFGVVSTWTWRKLSSVPLAGGGTYAFKLLKGEDGVQIDALAFVLDGSTPTSPPLVALVPGAFFVAPPPVGNDSNPGTAAQPWATLAKAAATLTAGQTVYIRGGSYTISDVITPLNVGSEGARITYEGFPGEVPVFDASPMWNMPFDRSFAINLAGLGDTFIRIKNLEIRNGCEGINAGQRSEILNCRIIFMRSAGMWVADRSRIISNLVQAVHAQYIETQSSGQECISVGGWDVEVAYNEVCYGGKEGIDFKWGAHRAKIHHNYVHHQDEWANDYCGFPFACGIYIDAAAPQSHIQVWSNVIHDCEHGIVLYAEIYSDESDDLSECHVHHNMMWDIQWLGIGVDNQGAAGGRTRNVKVLNNTVVGSVRRHVVAGGHGIKVGANVSNILVRNNISISNNANLTVVAGGVGVVTDYNITSGNPLFVNAASGDFRLASAASPAVDAGHPDLLYNDPDGTRNDIGAFPFSQTPRPVKLDVRSLAFWNFEPQVPNGDTAPSAAKGTDFGAVNYTFGWADRSFAIRNAGGTNLTLTGVPIVAVSGTHAAEFTVITQPVVTAIAGAGSVQCTVRFDPAGAGERTATISIASDDPAANPYTFAVKGTGTLTPPAIAVLWNDRTITNGTDGPWPPDGTDLGPALVGAGHTNRTFIISNEGGSNLVLNGVPAVVVDGPNAAEFSIAPQPVSPIAGGTSTPFTVQFSPAYHGVRLARLAISNTVSGRSPYTLWLAGFGDDMGAYVQAADANGVACGEAEGLHANEPGAGSSYGGVWRPYADPSAAAHVYMMVPQGSVIGGGGSNVPARMDYFISMAKTGRHYLWVRARSARGGGFADSVFVSYDDKGPYQVTTTSSTTTWTWTKANAIWTNNTIGLHGISIHLREDGTQIDRVLVTSSATYNPASYSGGLGPTTSPLIPEPAAMLLVLACGAASVRAAGYTQRMRCR